MRPVAHFRVPDGRVVPLGHGDLIGRLESAALAIADPRISEAHAMVSLRGTSLKLLALRGRFAVKGKALAEVTLEPGLAIELARDLEISVDDVTLPEWVPAVRLDRMEAQVITGVCSLFVSPKCELRPGFHPAARGFLWPGEAKLILRLGAEDRALGIGDVVDIDGADLEVVAMTLDVRGDYVTTARGAVSGPLQIVARYESAHIFRQDEPVLVISGISARILSELVAIGVPVGWATVAHEIWPDEPIDDNMRAKWDVSVGRLRRKLERARIRGDLVRSDGLGNVELSLEQGDTARDEA